MSSETILRDVKFLHAKTQQGSSKMHNCTKMLRVCIKIIKPQPVVRLVNNTAPGRRQGLNRRTLKGKSDLRSVSVRRPPIPVQVFRTKCLRGDVKIQI